MDDLERLMAIAETLPPAVLLELLEHAEALKREHGDSPVAMAGADDEPQEGAAYWLKRLVPVETFSSSALAGAASEADMLQRVKELRLTGHGVGLNLALFSEQGLALTDAALRAVTLIGAVTDAADRMIRDWPAVLAGAPVAVDICEHVGYVGTVTWQDDVRPEAFRLIEEDVLRFEAFESLPQSKAIRQAWARRLESALIMVLDARGLLKGPCEECGREKWVPKYQPASARGGRPRLSETLCPACLVVKSRAKMAEKKRRQRAKAAKA